MTPNYPLVSIIIPTFNSARYLPRCLKAIANQSYKAIEVIIVDAGSTDNSQEIIDSFEHNLRIKTLTFLESTQSEARNLGLEHANGEYISFCDSDDFYLSDKIKIQLESLQKNNVDVSYFDVLHFHSDNFNQLFINRHPASNDILADSIANQIINLNSVMVKKAFLTHHKLAFPTGEMGRYGEDGNFIFQLALNNAKFIKIDNPLSVVEVRKDSHTQWDAQWKMKFYAITYLSQAKTKIDSRYLPQIDQTIKRLKIKLIISLIIAGHYDDVYAALKDDFKQSIITPIITFFLRVLPHKAVRSVLIHCWQSFTRKKNTYIQLEPGINNQISLLLEKK